STSSAVYAVMSGGTVVSTCGSVTEMSGTSARAPIVTLILRLVSVTTQNCETSEPDPPVVGTITVGGSGPATLPTPAESVIPPPCTDSNAIAFAASIQLRPPTAT